jgi:hypothetical protein
VTLSRVGEYEEPSNVNGWSRVGAVARCREVSRDMDVEHGSRELDRHEHEISHRSSSVLQITSHIMYDHNAQ